MTDRDATASSGTADTSATDPFESTIQLVVCGAHLSGQPLNHQITDRGGQLVRAARTAEFLCEPIATAGALEITSFGGWQAHLSQHK